MPSPPSGRCGPPQASTATATAALANAPAMNHRRLLRRARSAEGPARRRSPLPMRSIVRHIRGGFHMSGRYWLWVAAEALVATALALNAMDLASDSWPTHRNEAYPVRSIEEMRAQYLLLVL